MIAAADLGRHVAHVVVFGVPIVTLLGAIGWQELRARVGRVGGRPAGRDPAERLDRGQRSLIVASAGLIVGGAVHFAVMPEHFREYTLYGIFFTVLAIAQLLVAWAMLAAPSRRLVRAVAVTTLGVIALWIASRTTGIPLADEPWTPERVGILDVIATTAETITAGACVIALVGSHRFRVSSHHRLPELVR